MKDLQSKLYDTTTIGNLINSIIEVIERECKQVSTDDNN